MTNDNSTSFHSHSIKIMRIVGLFFAIQFFPTAAFNSICICQAQSMDLDNPWVLLYMCKPQILGLGNKSGDHISVQCAINLQICLHNFQIETEKKHGCTVRVHA